MPKKRRREAEENDGPGPSMPLLSFDSPEVEIQGLTISIGQSCSTVATEFFTETQQSESQDSKPKLKKSSDSIVKNIRVKKDGDYFHHKFENIMRELPQFRSWLVQGESLGQAYCTVCDKAFAVRKTVFIRHSKSKSHLNHFERLNSSEPSESYSHEQEISEFKQRTIDLRSDTVTQPNSAMKRTIIDASFVDSRFQDDPTVSFLEEKVADLLGKEAALFVPTGTMANLICVMTHCSGRASEVIVGDESHIHLWAQGGVAQVGCTYHRTLKNLPDGTFSLPEMLSLLKGNNHKFSTIGLVCIENAHNMKGGRALPLAWVDEVGRVCEELNVPLHMDGARLLNVAVATGESPDRLVEACDSVALCLNKGLGAPMGSIIVGTKDFVKRASRIRKILGGDLHQVGMMAAAGIYALDNIYSLLSVDHSNARVIAQSVADKQSDAIQVKLEQVQTNVVFLHCDKVRVTAKDLCVRLVTVPDREVEDIKKSITVLTLPVSDSILRLMTHCNIQKADVKAVIEKLEYVISEYDSMYVV